LLPERVAVPPLLAPPLLLVPADCASTADAANETSKAAVTTNIASFFIVGPSIRSRVSRAPSTSVHLSRLDHRHLLSCCSRGCLDHGAPSQHRADGAAQGVSRCGLRSSVDGVRTTCGTWGDRYGAVHGRDWVEAARSARPERIAQRRRRPPENGPGPGRAHSGTDGLPAGGIPGMLRDIMRPRPRGWAG
jgi:hypothetical protein